MMVEEKLAQAFKETFDERTERVMKIEKKHRFSLAYRLWERKMLSDIRKKRVSERWTLKRAKAFVAAGITAIFAVVGGTAIAVVNTGRFGFVDKRDYSKMLIENHPSDKTTLEEYYGLPEEDGWELTDYDIVCFSSTLNYKRGDTIVSFDQMLIQEGNMGNISTDRAKIEPLSLYEESDGFVLEFRDDNSLIYWIYDGYLLSISGNINKNEVIKLAYSTKIVDLTKKF